MESESNFSDGPPGIQGWWAEREESTAIYVVDSITNNILSRIMRIAVIKS